MAKRPIFISNKNNFEVNIEFDWYPGFSISQKQKSIKSLHDNFLEKYPNHKVLEVSTKSEIELGRKLSAFNLKNKDGKTVEELYQIGKVFANNKRIKSGDYNDIRELRHKIKEIKDPIIYFEYKNEKVNINPPTLFYDWLYIKVLLDNENLKNQLILSGYDSFTDIEFNPLRQINCQARAVSIYIYLVKINYFDTNPLFTIEKFEDFYVSDIYNGLL